VISVVGKLLGAVVGAEGLACRFGGDEFVAFVRGNDQAQGCALAERLRAALAAAAVELNGVHVRPTLSIGVAAFPAQAQNGADLLARADEALYRAKRAGPTGCRREPGREAPGDPRGAGAGVRKRSPAFVPRRP
jgi:diguanylate cyclase (GGDEF)-like protein